MQKQEIINRLREIIRPYTKDTDALDNLDDQTSFIKDLHINSAHLVDIVLDVEEAFDIEINNELMERMLTVGAAIDIVQEQSKQDN